MPNGRASAAPWWWGYQLGGRSYAAVKMPDGWALEGGQGAPFTYMREIVFTLANLRAVRAEVKENRNLTALGLDRPFARVVLCTQRPEPVEAMSFGMNDSQPGMVYVRRKSTRFVYVLSSYILDELRRPTLSEAFAGR